MTGTGARSINWLTLVVMTWAAVWCCCVPPASAKHTGNGRACCMEKVIDPAKLPADVPPCPIVQLRESSEAATPLVLPSFEPTLVALPAMLLVPQPLQTVATTTDFSGLADPPPPAPTLLALHTSLVW